MNFPELKTARVLSEAEMLNFRGGACSSCKSGCSSSCKGGCSQSKKNNIEVELPVRDLVLQEVVRRELRF